MWPSRALLFAATLLCGSIGHAHAESLCQSERSPNDRTFHCIDFGTKRFRVPNAHLIVRLRPDADTGRMDKPDTLSPALRERLATFFYIARLPDLSPVTRSTESGLAHLATQVTAIVTRSDGWTGIPPRTQRAGNQWVFAESIVEALAADGFQPRGGTPGRPLSMEKDTVAYRFGRETAGIVEMIRDSRADGLYSCLLPYAEGIVVGILLFENRERACIEGRRVVAKLRSFEY